MKNYFHEVQRLDLLWFRILPYIIIGLGLVITISQLVFDQPIGSTPIPNDKLWMFWLGAIIIVGYIRIFRLITDIHEDGITIALKPFFKRTYHWDEIDDMYMRKYNPLLDRGSYVFKFMKPELSYSFRIVYGVQLKNKRRKNVFIGTQKKEEMEEVLKKLEYKLHQV